MKTLRSPGRKVHRLGAHDECHVAQAGAQAREGLVEPGRRTRARVVAVDDGNALEPHRPQRGLAADAVLAFEHALARVGEPGRIDLVLLARGVGQRCGHRLRRQCLDRAVEVLAQRGHADADDVDLRHGVLLVD